MTSPRSGGAPSPYSPLGRPGTAPAAGGQQGVAWGGSAGEQQGQRPGSAALKSGLDALRRANALFLPPRLPAMVTGGSS